MLGNNSICYEAQQRIYRNTVVGFLREHLPRILPGKDLQRLEQMFGEAWTKGKVNAAKSRESSGTSTQLRDDYDLLGVTHFFEIFTAFFDKLFSVRIGYPPDRPRPKKAKFLGNIQSLRDARDPISHPVEEEIPYDEAFGLLIEARQVLEDLGCRSEADEIRSLAEALSGGPETPTVLRQLPTEDSLYLEFVGRVELLEQLTKHFDSPEHRRCLLAGDGGKGKSAIAYRFAQQIAESSDRFYVVVWISAKRKRFQSGAVLDITTPEFATLEEAIDRLLTAYGAVETDFQMPVVERRRLLLDYLSQYPAFVVVDDIDTLLDDFEVVSLFTHDIPHTGSSVLITSRRDIPGIRRIVVNGFDLDEARQFVESRQRLYCIDESQFTSKTVLEAFRATDGSPLYLDDLLRLTKVLGAKKAIQAWSERRGDDARKYALQRELEALSPDAKQVLVAASIANGPISFAELESILRFSEDRLSSALDELQTMFLFPAPRLVKGEQRFEINLNTKKLVRLIEVNSDLYKRIERESKALSGTLPKVGRDVIGSLIRQAQLRLNAQQYQEGESILSDAIVKYPQVADLHSFLGYFYRRCGRIADARYEFARAEKLKGRRRDMYLQWVAMEIYEKEWSKAIVIAERAIKRLPDVLELKGKKVYAKRQAGFDFHRGLHREKAERMWTEAVDDGEAYVKDPQDLQPGEREPNSAIMCSIVICLDMLGRLLERDWWFRRWAGEHPEDPQVERQRWFLIQKRRGAHSDPLAPPARP